MRSVAEAVASWCPEGGDDVDAAEVEAVRAVVVAAGLSAGRVHEVPQVLRYCWEYLAFRRRHGLSTDPRVAFAGDAIDAYRKTLRGPRGSISARCSYLRRLHPDVGLDGTTRTTVDDDCDEEAGDDVAGPGHEPAALPDAAPRPRPALLDDAHWEPVAELTWRCVDAVAPQRRARAQMLITHVAYLAAWVEAQHRPLKVDVVLAGRTIEDFLAAVLAGGRSPRGVATMAANLHAVREANGVACDVERRNFGAPTPKRPYTAAEIDDMYRIVARIRSERRRVPARTALSLTFGAGATPGDCGWVTVDDVVETADGVLVGLGTPPQWDTQWTATDPTVLAGIERRWVSVFDDYADDVLAARHWAAGAASPFLLGGVGGKRSERAAHVLRGKSFDTTIAVDLTRARAGWLIEVAARGQYPVLSDLLDAAGLQTPVRFGELVDDIRDRAAELRGDPGLLPSLEDDDADTSDPEAGDERGAA